MNRWKYIAGLCVVMNLAFGCSDRVTEKDSSVVNKTDTRRNTTGTENTLVSHSASPTRDSAQHGGPDKPAQ